MDLVKEMFDLNNELTASIRKLAENGKKLAEAERDYKITLREEALKLRVEKDMPVTLINQIIFGVPKVAELRFKRDIAETIYNTNQEHINCTKLKIRILESQINREWSSN
jgi:hypothetical protein